MNDASAEALLSVVAGVQEGFQSAQATLRDQVFAAASVDERVRLDINGEGLALRVTIEPALLADGVEAVQLAVMQAINNAAIELQAQTTAAFQFAAANALGIPPADEIDDLPPSLRGLAGA